MEVVEHLRVAKLLEVHFCETLEMTFTFFGEPIAPMNVFDKNFLLGMACLVIDQSEEFSDPEYPLIKSRRPSDQALFGVDMDIAPLNGYRMFQILSVMESFFDLKLTEEEYGGEVFELEDLVSGLLQEHSAAKERERSRV